MKNFTIHPSKLSGSLVIPPSKSQTQRALLFGMLSKGKSVIKNPLDSSDTEAMICAISQFGAKVASSHTDRSLEIQGGFSPPNRAIDAKNSGLTLRFAAAVSSLLPKQVTLTGDPSIQTRRPIEPLMDAIIQLRGKAESLRKNGHAPIAIRGPITAGRCKLNGEDSQPVSALLIATSFLKGTTTIAVENPGETPWIDLTLEWLRTLGASISHNDCYTHYEVKGGLEYRGFTYQVPKDFSTAAFPIAAALITQSPLTLKGLDPKDSQGDKRLISILQKMGGRITWRGQNLEIFPSNLKGIKIDLNPCIDALPILATLGCFAKGETLLYNGAIARKKESDRIAAISQELKKMGAQITPYPDGLSVKGGRLVGGELNGHGDHRIALALAIGALGAKGPSLLKGIECIDKTYPSFLRDFRNIGASIQLEIFK